MDQQCLKCDQKFRLAILKRVEGVSNYPIASEAVYCPFCGDDLVQQEIDVDFMDVGYEDSDEKEE